MIIPPSINRLLVIAPSWIGDAIMALFGAPLSSEDDADKAVAVACAAGHEALTVAGFSPIEYLEVRAADTLSAADQATAGKPLRALAAAWLGQTRLIDNISIGSSGLRGGPKT